MTDTLFGAGLIEDFRASVDEQSRKTLAEAVSKIVTAKKHGGKVMVVTGSGPNIHEGVTTLIAELIRVGIVDAVSTSSAVISHEMAGSLDRVFRVSSDALGFPCEKMPRGDEFEFTRMSDAEWDLLRLEMPLDSTLFARAERLPIHSEIIKTAGNMAYPMGLRTERLAHEVLALAKMYGLPFEAVAGWGCDERTMLGAAARKGVPVLVTIPQMIGGGAVGMSIGDSIPVSERSMRISRMLASCDVIKTVQEAIDKGLPKTKAAKIPFRMEMSAFARHEGSLPIIGDIGKVWPVIAHDVAEALGVELDFLSASQDTPEGQNMRSWIVDTVKPLDRNRMLEGAKSYSKF